jgi:hypothetical protein
MKKNSQPFFFLKLLNPKNRIFNDKDPTAPPCRSIDEVFAQPSKERACCSLKPHQISPNKSSMIPPHPEAIYRQTVITKIYELPRVTTMPVPTFQAQRKASSNNTEIHTLLWFWGKIRSKKASGEDNNSTRKKTRFQVELSSSDKPIPWKISAWCTFASLQRVVR